MKKISIRKREYKKGISNITATICHFESQISAIVDGRTFNAKSIMNIPIIEKAGDIDFIIIGKDEEAAEIAIKKLYDV